MLIPFLALLFLLIDLGWALFVKSALQHAVREGARYGVTGHTSADIVAWTQHQAMGLLDGDQAGTIAVNCWKSGDPKPSPPDPAGCDTAGKLLEVSVNAYQIKPLATLLHSSNPVMVTVSAADVLEAAP